jgi:hypothetical protein
MEMLKFVATFFAVMVLAVASYAGQNDTSEALAASLAGAVNAKDVAGVKALVHSQCFVNLSPAQKEWLDDVLATDFNAPMPMERTVKVTKLGDKLPYGDKVTWPVKPTHRLVIEFTRPILVYNDDTSKGVIRQGIFRWIVKENNKWFIVLPMLSNDDLKAYKDQKGLSHPPKQGLTLGRPVSPQPFFSPGKINIVITKVPADRSLDVINYIQTEDPRKTLWDTKESLGKLPAVVFTNVSSTDASRILKDLTILKCEAKTENNHKEPQT